MGLTTEEYKKKSSKQLIDILKDQKASLFVFQHNYEEGLHLIKNALQWVNNTSYDPSKASLVTQYFMENHCVENDIFLARKNYEDFFKNKKIEIYDQAEPSLKDRKNYDYQISIEELEQKLQKRQPATNKGTISKDVKSIENIINFRKGKLPSSLKEAKYIFVTKNTTLASLSREEELRFLEKNKPGVGNSFLEIPCCMTDVSLCCITWLNGNQQILYNSSRLNFASYCYSFLKPEPELLNQFYSEIKKQQKKGTVTLDDFNRVKVDKNTSLILAEVTQNNMNNYNDETMQEVLERVKNNNNEESQEKIRELEEAKEKLEEENKKLKEEKEKKSEKKAKIFSWIIISLAYPFLFAIIYFLVGSFFATISTIFLFLVGTVFTDLVGSSRRKKN